MSDGNFKIISKAEELYFDVFDITTNRKHYPVKFKRLSDSLQKYSLELHRLIRDANAYKTDTYQHRNKRYELQTEAIARCEELLSLIKYSLHAGLISVATCERWTCAASDVKHMILAWRKSG